MIRAYNGVHQKIDIFISDRGRIFFAFLKTGNRFWLKMQLDECFSTFFLIYGTLPLPKEHFGGKPNYNSVTKLTCNKEIGWTLSALQSTLVENHWARWMQY